MMARTEADTPVALSPWRPEQNAVALAALGKLLEELGELTAITARCVIQGIDECEPETGMLNRAALEKEIADVLAGVDVVVTLFDLNEQVIARRMKAKVEHLTRWHALLVGEKTP